VTKGLQKSHPVIEFPPVYGLGWRGFHLLAGVGNVAEEKE